ncbi:MAG: tetratricopeptide repeat protein [Myxococcales bacterium]|nr:tetratricopeptide repeat protein [Myxococcales bacterium]
MEPFGKYQILRRLGAGGMAEVFLAREPLIGGLSKVLVIKKIHPGLAQAPQFRAMFEDEAKIGVILNHPNIVQTFNYGQLGHTYFLAMERVEGVDLLRLIHAAAAAGRKVPPGLAAYVMQQVAKGLDYAHRKADDAGEALHIVHRDVSPQNILVSFDGAVKIVDFGIARARGQKPDEGVVKGKFAYMSPEQASGLPIDRRSDIFAAGIVLYELTTGRALFGRMGERQALEAIRSALVPRPRDADPDLPEELERIILKSLARRAEDRFQTARDLQQALGKFFFSLGSQEGEIYESGAMAAFVAQVVPQAERNRIRALEEPQEAGGVEARAAARRAVASSTEETSPTQPNDDELATGPSVTPTASVTSGDAGHLPLVAGPRERKNVVVVEGALGGLAALRRQLGETRARGVLLDFLRVAEHVAYKHHAHADRLDERGFTYLIGLPVGAEDDPSRAIQLALALIDALDGIVRDLRPPLHLSIGVEAGAALVGRSTVTGDARFEHELCAPVGSIARRLAEEAMPGEVLVGGEVFRAARGEWRFEELEAIGLAAQGASPAEAVEPGEPSRVRVFRTLGATPRAERMTAPGSALWGRELELQALEDAARDVATRGQGRFLLAVGDRGVGKRSLVARLWARLDPATHLVLRTVGSLGRRDTPYALTADLARDLLGVGDVAEPRDLKRMIQAGVAELFSGDGGKRVKPITEALALLLGLHVPGADEIDPAERRHRLYQGIRAIGDRLARERTLVLIVEDLHFADTQSFELLLALARDPLPRPVLILATARHEARPPELADTDDGGVEIVIAGTTRAGVPGPETLHEDARIEILLGEPNVSPIFVGELSPRAREGLLRARFERPDDEAVAALIRTTLDRAGGNPFYLNEILESLAERGILAVGESGGFALKRLDTEVAVPLSIEALIGARLDRLPDEERAAVRAAAVLGRIFRAVDLAALLDSVDAAPLIERLTVRGLLVPVEEGPQAAARSTEPRGEFAFRSALAQEIAYGGLAAEVRASFHRRAAERLAGSPSYHRGADDARIAHHLQAAGEPIEAGRAFARAGIHARDVSGNAEAWRHFGQALALFGDQPALRAECWDLHAEREQILRALGQRDDELAEVTVMRRLAEDLGDAGRLARSLARLSSYYLDTGKHAAARRESARARETARAAGDRITEAEALRLDATLLIHIGRYPEALLCTRDALAALGDPEDRAGLLERAQVQSAVGTIERDQGRGQEAARAYGEALAIHRRLGSRRRESATLNNLGNVAISQGDLEQALAHYKHSLKIDQEIGDRVGLGATLGNIGQVHALLGDHDRAHRHLVRALELDEASRDMSALTDASISIGQVDLRRGEIAAAAEHLERGLELAQATRSRYQEIRALVYLAFCKLAAGAPPDLPLDLARSAVKLAREAAIPNGVAFGLIAEGLALARSGRREEAADRSAEAVALCDAGRVDEAEEVLFHHARLAAGAGRSDEAAASLARARAEVRKKAARLRDEQWRSRYLAAPPASEILEDSTPG